MHAPTHDIMNDGSSGPSSRRTAIIGGVAMLHIVIVYALISGMAGQIAKYIPQEITTRFLDDKTKTADVPPPPKPALVQPHETVDTIRRPSSPSRTTSRRRSPCSRRRPTPCRRRSPTPARPA